VQSAQTPAWAAEAGSAFRPFRFVPFVDTHSRPGSAV